MSGDKYLITEQNSPYYVTFTRLSYKKIVTDNLNWCIENKGLIVWAWCLMSNHLHAVLQAREGHELSAIIRDYKKHASKVITNAIETEPESRREWMLHRFEWAGKADKRNTKYKFWQESNHAILFDPLFPAVARQKIEYIHNNPVRVGIVTRPEDYLYSSAIDYCGGAGLVKVNLWI
jgi:putative transposase